MVRTYSSGVKMTLKVGITPMDTTIILERASTCVREISTLTTWTTNNKI